MNSGIKLYEKAKKFIPGGTQLLSKRPEMFLPNYWPSYYSRAKGCEVWDLDGNKYIDASIFSAGTCIFGYAYEPIDNAAKEAIDSSIMSTLNAPEEVELSEVLLELHPWANMARYAKAGGESMSMAVRIARAYTKKDIVLVCGYHGWHDWYLAANLTKGDPLAAVHLSGLEPLGVPRDLAGSNLIFHYNDFNGFMKIINEHKGNIAAVVMEPIRNNKPEDGFLDKIRAVTKEHGIVLVFDEITAGFRMCCGGSHLILDVEPDIAVFAKCLANGYSIAAVIGRGEVMSAAEETFISSTFWTERIGFSAALKAIEEHKRIDLHSHLIRIGKKVQDGWQMIADNHGISINIGGIYPLSHFQFSSDATACKTYFTQEMLKRGYLATTAFYVSYAHTDEVVDKYFEACDAVFGNIARALKGGTEIESLLDGPVCHAGFQRLN